MHLPGPGGHFPVRMGSPVRFQRGPCGSLGVPDRCKWRPSGSLPCVRRMASRRFGSERDPILSPGHAALGELGPAAAPAVGRSRIGPPWLPCGRSRSPRLAGAPSTSTTVTLDDNPRPPCRHRAVEHVSGLAPGVEAPCEVGNEVGLQGPPLRPGAIGFPGRSSYAPVRGRGLVVGRRWMLCRCHRSNSRARKNTSSSISSVNFLVFVFCWLTW
jgi:hypothetical protein